MVQLDLPTIRKSATAGLIVIVPATFLANLLVPDSPARSGLPGILALFFLAVGLFGFAAAGYTAGRLRPDTPMAHGSMGALLAWVIVQAFGLIRVASRGDSISWAALPIWAIIATTGGVLGALYADWQRRNR